MTNAMLSPLAILAIAVAIAGSVSDVRARRIPNWLTVGALLLALTLRGFGPEPILSGIAAAGVAFAVGLPLFALRVIGGGDVKYLTAFGAIVGMERIGLALVLVSLAGGVLALVGAIASGRGRTLLANTGRLFLHAVTLGFAGSRRVLTEANASDASPPIPLGVAIAVGCVLVFFL